MTGELAGLALSDGGGGSGGGGDVAAAAAGVAAGAAPSSSAGAAAAEPGAAAGVAAGTAADAAAAPAEKKKSSSGGGKKGKGGGAKAEVVLERNTRNKKKCITTISGLDMFGVKLGEAAKLFGKKFASGASVTKTADGREQIDVQVCARACVVVCVARRGTTPAPTHSPPLARARTRHRATAWTARWSSFSSSTPPTSSGTTFTLSSRRRRRHTLGTRARRAGRWGHVS